LGVAGEHESVAPSAWVERWARAVPAGGRVLDLACGSGRHARLFAAKGCIVTAVDRDPACGAALSAARNVEFIAADLEAGLWPLRSEFDAIVVTNYLHRPLASALLAALAPGGLLIYETFAAGNAAFGKPANPDFLLVPRELLDTIGAGLRVLAFEDGYVEVPRPAMVQRIAARKTAPREALPPGQCAL
jgi:SAM-dependent methyltransferase